MIISNTLYHKFIIKRIMPLKACYSNPQNGFM